MAEGQETRGGDLFRRGRRAAPAKKRVRRSETHLLAISTLLDRELVSRGVALHAIEKEAKDLTKRRQKGKKEKKERERDRLPAGVGSLVEVERDMGMKRGTTERPCLLVIVASSSSSSLVVPSVASVSRSSSRRGRLLVPLTWVSSSPGSTVRLMMSLRRRRGWWLTKPNRVVIVHASSSS